MEDNRKFATIWSVLFMTFWAFCLIMSLSDESYLRCRSIYAIALAVCIVTLILSVFADSGRPGMIMLTAIVVEIVPLAAGVFIAMNLAPKTITIFASVLVVPVMFISDSVSVILLFMINAFAFSMLGAYRMEPETYRWTLSNLIIFSCIGTLIGYFVNKTRFERYLLAESAVQLAESNEKLAELQTKYAYYDQMTGLQNRRAYAEMMDRIAENMPADLCIVMADINGLKEMNDTYGHDAGDELIIGSADCLRHSFQEDDAIYRIGGDEFSVILESTEESVNECLRQLEKLCGSWKGKYADCISISCGFSSAKEFADLDYMRKMADQRMIASKREYYRKSGKDRRQR